VQRTKFLIDMWLCDAYTLLHTHSERPISGDAGSTRRKTMDTQKANQMNDQYLGAMTQTMEEQMGRFETTLEEMSQRNQQALDGANAAIGEWAKLAREAVAMSHQMSSEWIKTARGSAQKASDISDSMAGR
jgi:hypothetical protein